MQSPKHACVHTDRSMIENMTESGVFQPNKSAIRSHNLRTLRNMIIK